jgi:hypothetical protein
VAPLLILLGGVALLAAAGLLASFGERLRVGRLLARTRPVELAELPNLATTDSPPYVRVEGRVDSDEPFEDAAHRPLVYRRTRVQLRTRTGWRTVDDGVESVPFTLADALGACAIEPADLGVGLVVITREASGVAADIADRVPRGTPPDRPARVRIDQVSSIEHAIALGVPHVTPDGVALRPARGRPLVLTTLEPPEAMRILAGGRQALIRLSVALFGIGAASIALGVTVAVVRAAGVAG